jgi:Flp pilus assembly secretin CpaC
MRAHSIDHPLAIAVGLAFCALAMIAAKPAAAETDLTVKYDQSQLLRLPRPAAEIIIGNPTIADVSVQASNMLVVTGKGFGITNMIVLDIDREVIEEFRVLVVRESVKVVNLQKGNKRETYNCAPQCNPSLVVGDDQAYFESTVKTSERKIKFSEGNSDGGAASPQGQ